MKNRSIHPAGRLITSERGLTLVEILVVLIILGIVVTFLGSKIFGAGDRAKADLSVIMMKSLQGQIEQYRLRYNALPASLEDLARCNEHTGPGCIPLVKEDELADAWGNKFSFSLDNGGRTYRIKTFGADGRDGGDAVNYDAFVTGP